MCKEYRGSLKKERMTRHMAKVKAFQAFLAAPEYASAMAALPYDVYNSKEAREAVAANPLSFLAIDRAETAFPESADPHGAAVYEKAGELLWERVRQGYYRQDEREAYYLYQLVMNGRTQTGIVACASIDDYIDNKIRRHENTRADKEQDRICHVEACRAQTGPVFLAYRQTDELRRLTGEAVKQKPLYDFTAEDGVIHRMWRVCDAGWTDQVSRCFEEMEAVYIADGHHRCASAVRVGLNMREADPDYTGREEYNYFLSVLFPDEELCIMDYNRVVKDLNGLGREAFMERISASFVVEKQGSIPYRPQKPREFGMYLEGEWYRLTAKSEVCGRDAVSGLDVSLLQDYLLGPVLGIGDPRTDRRIDFVGGIRGLKELERRVSEDMKVAFSMYPTSIGELLAVADAGALMPPKSTWFEPKLRSGLFFHKIG